MGPGGCTDLVLLPSSSVTSSRTQHNLFVVAIKGNRVTDIGGCLFHTFADIPVHESTLGVHESTCGQDEQDLRWQWCWRPYTQHASPWQVAAQRGRLVVDANQTTWRQSTNWMVRLVLMVATAAFVAGYDVTAVQQGAGRICVAWSHLVVMEAGSNTDWSARQRRAAHGTPSPQR